MVNKSKKILTEISAGELLDKISILEIKLHNIKDKEKLTEINKEYKIAVSTPAHSKYSNFIIFGSLSMIKQLNSYRCITFEVSYRT